MNSVDQDLLIKQLKCCSGQKAAEVANKLILGSHDAQCEFRKLALLIKCINVLSCHKSPLVNTTYSVVDGQLISSQTTTTYNNCLTQDEAEHIADTASKICEICN